MGQWHISVRGHGIHHNGRPDDADAMAEKFVQELRAAGHEVYGADITVGSSQPLTNPPALPPEPSGG